MGKERKRLRKKTAELEAIHAKDLAKAYADLNADGVPLQSDDPRQSNVVKPLFKDPLKGKSAKQTAAENAAKTEETIERLVAARKKRKASGGTR